MRARAFFLYLPALVKLLLAWKLEMSVDESHYVLYGRWLDWSYFDHPPMVGWLHGLMSLLPFWEVFARLPAIAIGVFLTWDIDRWLTAKTGDQRLSFWVVTGLNYSPALFGMTFLLLPEAPFLLFSWLTFRVLDSCAGRQDCAGRAVPLPGVTAAGLAVTLAGAGLSKYTAGLLVPGIFAEARARGWLRGVRNWMMILGAVGLALLLISPVLWWNYRHDFASFKYQTDHVVKTGFDLKIAATSLFGLWAAFGFFLSPWMFIGLRGAYTDSSWRTMRALLSGPALFFLYAALTSEVLPHWGSVVFLFGIVLGLARAWPRWSHVIRRCVWATALIDFALVSQLLVPFVPGAELASRDVAGWHETRALLRELHAQKEFSSVEGIIATHWTYGGRSVLYFGDLLPVHVVDDRQDQYDLWLSPPTPMKDFFVLHHSYEAREPRDLVKCSELSLVKQQAILVGGKPIYDVQIWFCRRFLRAPER